MPPDNEATIVTDTTAAQQQTASIVEPAKEIPVSGKNAEVVAKLAALPKPAITMKEVEFSFKTPRSNQKAPELLADGVTKNPDAGKPVDELGKVLEKRPSIKLAIPVITFDGLLEALSNDKQQQFILDIIEEYTINAAKQQVSPATDEVQPVNDQEHLDISKLTIEFLANQPRAERRGGGIAKEIWEAFAKDYIDVMPAVSNKTADQVGNAAKILLSKFQLVKTQKTVISYLQTQLALWFQNTKQQEEFAECYEFLDSKAKALLSANEADLLASL